MVTRESPLGNTFLSKIRALAHSFSPTAAVDWWWAVLFSAVILLLRFIYIVWFAPYGLSPDEAQYWTWLTHMDWSYLTKPPLTTWLMGLSTFFLGDTKLGVKFFALVGQFAIGLLAWQIAYLAAQNGTKRLAALAAWGLVSTAPLLAGGGLIMSPDAVLVPLWMAATLQVVRALREGISEQKALCWPRWLLLGLMVGLGGLAKYSAGAFYPLLGVWMLFWRPKWLHSPAVWGSALLALALQLPVLYWNIAHHGAGAQHVMWQTSGGGDTRHGGFASFGEFLASQLLVLGPIVFFLLLAAWGQSLAALKRWARMPAAEGLLLVLSLPIFGGFLVMSFSSKVQANWPVLGTVGGLLVLAVWLARFSLPHAKRWVLKVAVAGVLLNTGLSVILLNTHEFHEWGLFPVPMKHDPTKDLRGWTQMGPLLGMLLDRLDNPIVLTSRYQTLAPLAFHTPPNMRNGLNVAYMNAENRRLNQYDLWPQPDMTDRVVVYANEKNFLPPMVEKSFKGCQKWHTLAVEDFGETTRTLSLWICWGWHGSAMPRPSQAVWMH